MNLVGAQAADPQQLADAMVVGAFRNSGPVTNYMVYESPISGATLLCNPV